VILPVSRLEWVDTELAQQLFLSLQEHPPPEHPLNQVENDLEEEVEVMDAHHYLPVEGPAWAPG